MAIFLVTIFGLGGVAAFQKFLIESDTHVAQTTGLSNWEIYRSFSEFILQTVGFFFSIPLQKSSRSKIGICIITIYRSYGLKFTHREGSDITCN